MTLKSPFGELSLRVIIIIIIIIILIVGLKESVRDDRDRLSEFFAESRNNFFHFIFFKKNHKNHVHKRIHRHNSRRQLY